MVPQRHTIPPQVEAAVMTALEKLPADRFATAAEFAEALNDAGYASRATVAMGAVVGPVATAWKRRFVLASVVAAVAIGLAAWGWARARAEVDQPAAWQYISVGDSVAVTLNSPPLALSPDGSELVFKADGQNGRLWIKRNGALNPVPIPGTERSGNPVFSPDGEWVAFVADQQLRKVRPSSGAAVVLADSVATGFGGATWLDDGSLVYVSLDLNRLVRIDASGRNSTVVLDNRGLRGAGFSSPTPLPGSRGVLFQSCTSGCITMSLMALDFKSGEPKLLLSEAAEGWYLPTGDLLYVRRDGTALVAPFDLAKLEVVGAGIPVFQNVFISAASNADLAWSLSGTVVYVTGGSQDNESLVFRTSLDGASTPVDTSWTGQMTALAVSPDGKRLAVGMGVGAGGQNIWIKDLDHGPLTRLTFGGSDRRPVWSPDGRMVAFIRDTLGGSVVAARFADGSRPDTVLARIDRQIQEVDWSADGKWLVLRTDNGTAGAGDIVGIRTGGDTTEVPLVASPFTELHPAVSPDSRWIAYTSNESGQNEVYVRPFPNTNDGRWQVSTAGGALPRWSPDGTELYFLDPSSQMSSARITTTPTFAVGARRTLFGASGYTLDAFHQAYDISPDGKSFYIASPRRLADLGRAPTLVRVDHWFTDLKARLAQ
jgi:Tol biopolymer transport system component